MSVLIWSAGWQREPTGKVVEQMTMIDSVQFHEQFVTLGKPVVFRRAITNASAMKNWINNKYLIEKLVFWSTLYCYNRNRLYGESLLTITLAKIMLLPTNIFYAAPDAWNGPSPSL